MEFVSSELSGADFLASDWTDTALFTSESLACLSARLSTVEVCVSDLYCRVRPSCGGESRMHERDQPCGHGVKVSQSKLRRLRAKRVRYRLWSTARGPDPSCLVRAGIFAPRYYRNFCSDDSEEEEWVEDTCGTQTDMDAVELAGNSLRSQCSDCGTQTDPCVHIECGTQTDLCVLFVGVEEKEECHRVRVDRGDASLRMKRSCFKRAEAIESSKLRTSEWHATNGSAVESTAVWSSVDAVGSSSAVGSSTVRSAVGSSTVRSSADAVVDAVGSSTAGSSAVGSTAVWSSADAVASNPGCKDEEEENVHSEAVAKMEQEEVAEEDFVHAVSLAYSDSNESTRVYLEKALNLRIRKYRFVRTTATDDVVSTVHVPDFLSEFRACDEDERDCWIWDAFQTFRDHDSIEAVLHDLQQVMGSAAQPSALVKEAKHLYDNFVELCELQSSGVLDEII